MYEHIANISHSLDLTKNTLNMICNNVDTIQQRTKTGTKVRAKRIPYSRCSTMAHMEKMLSTWFKAQNKHHVGVSKLLFQAKVRYILFCKVKLSEDDSGH